MLSLAMEQPGYSCAKGVVVNDSVGRLTKFTRDAK